jgi:hypothetical protein
VPKLPTKITAFYVIQRYIVGHLMLKGRMVLFLFRVEYRQLQISMNESKDLCLKKLEDEEEATV